MSSLSAEVPGVRQELAHVFDHVRSGNLVEAMHHAVVSGDLKFVEGLVKKGAVDPNMRLGNNWTFVQLAGQEGHVPVMRFLLAQKSADVNAVNSSGHTALHYAAENGRVDAINLLLAFGADASPCDEYGYTPLCLAAREGKWDAARTLIEGGADWGYTLVENGLFLKGMMRFMINRAGKRQKETPVRRITGDDVLAVIDALPEPIPGGRTVT